MTSNKHETRIYAVARGHGLRNSVPPGSLIGGSWQRCVAQYGLDPASIGEDVLTHAELTTQRERGGAMVPVARSEMRNLAGQIAGSGYVLLLTDADGFILCHEGERSRERAFRAAGLWDGANWSETRQGTNGIGTALVERRAVTVHCGDHFALRNTDLSCSAAPILAPAGHLLGVLDASSVQCEDTRASQMHTIALVRMTAQAIEKQLFLDAWQAHRILRFHGRPEYVNLAADGMIAVDDDGRILAADHSAAIQLGFDDRGVLVGGMITEWFDLAAGLAQGNGPPGTVWPVRERRRGRRYYACLHEPVGAAARTRIPAARDDAAQRTGLSAVAGDDERMRENVRRTRRVIDKDIQIIIHGETGTGKEVFARAIHGASRRAAKPFVAVNCAALPESLIESELFGYAPGAFTGARSEGMRGKIEHASGGTLFLDEIGDMPLALQTRLLRVLEEREIVPVGSVKAVPVDLNLISATHAPLQTLVDEGRFRADLYYRLNGIAVTLPPVRERTDKRNLLHGVIAAENDSQSPVDVEPDALDALLASDWPGNIRQMRNVIRTALALCDGGCITRAELPADIVAAADDAQSASGTPLAAAEREALVDALEAAAGNVSACARVLGISRNTLYRKLRRHRIDAASYRRRPASNTTRQLETS